MKRCVLGIVILCIVCGTAMAATGAKEKLTVVVDQNYPPYMLGTAKQAEGLYPALIEAVFARIGIRAEIEAVIWKKA